MILDFGNVFAKLNFSRGQLKPPHKKKFKVLIDRFFFHFLSERGRSAKKVIEDRRSLKSRQFTHPHRSLKEHLFNQGGSITGNWTSSQSPEANNYPANFIHNGCQLNRHQHDQEMNKTDQRSLVIQPRSQGARMLVILPYAKGFSERGACGKLPWFWNIGARNSTWSTGVYI